MKTLKRALTFIVVLSMMVTMVVTNGVSLSAKSTGNGVLPYQDSGNITFYSGDINNSFVMMGIEYINGLTFGTTYSDKVTELYYNFESKYQMLSFDIGHLDNRDGNTVIFQIFKDGVLFEEITLTGDMSTYHYELNVSGVDQLKFATKAKYEYYYYGMANVTAYTTEDLVSAGITTIPNKKNVTLVENTNLDSAELALPYQYSGSVSIYNGDINRAFNMMGIEYINGLTFSTTYSNHVTRMHYNLGGIYQTFSFDMGHLDNRDGNTVIVQVFKDDVFAEEITFTGEMPTYHYDLNVSGVNKLSFVMKADYTYYAYGVANIRVSSIAETDSKSMTTVYDTNLTSSESVLPYQHSSSVSLYHNDVNRAFNMMGIEYIDGLTFATTYSNHVTRMHYNLGGIYQLFSFDIGHIDNHNGNTVILQVYKDGSLADEITLTGNMATYHYDMNVSGVNQLSFVMKSDYTYYTYGMANIRVYTVEDLMSSGITSIPSSKKVETIYDSNLVPGEQVLPYQYSENVGLYKGDINKTFTMMNIEYNEGITIKINYSTSGSESLFNLGGLYDTVSFDIGHIDGGDNHSAVLQIFKDDIYSGEINLTANMATMKNYTIDTDGVNQLKLALKNKVEYIAYGIANITAVHNHKETVLPAVPATCMTNGSTEGKVCATCGMILVEPDMILALGHNWVEKENVQPQGPIDGYILTECTKCGETYKTVLPGVKFSDVKENHWFYDAVSFVVSKGYMNGMSATVFSPNGNVTREQFVLILANMSGVNTDAYKGSTGGFTDITAGQWYTGAVVWAAEQGYVSGVKEGVFGRGQSITRAQLARLLFLYAGANGIDTTKRASVDSFADGATIEKYEWMRDGIKWAVAEGIISGMNVNNKLSVNPNGTATRAQAAVMLRAFDELK